VGVILFSPGSGPADLLKNDFSTGSFSVPCISEDPGPPRLHCHPYHPGQNFAPSQKIHVVIVPKSLPLFRSSALFFCRPALSVNPPEQKSYGRTDPPSGRVPVRPSIGESQLSPGFIVLFPLELGPPPICGRWYISIPLRPLSYLQRLCFYILQVSHHKAQV